MTASRRALGIVFLTVMIDLLGFGIVMPILVRYGKALEAGPAILGLLLSSFSAMQFLFAPIWGRVSDRVGRRPILILGLAGSVVFYALFGYASSIANLTLLFVSRIGAGIAGATISTAQAYIADVTPPERRTAGMALIGAAFGIGFTLGPILGASALLLEPGTVVELPVTEDQVLVESELPQPQADATASSMSPWPGYAAAGLSGLALVLAIFVLPESLPKGGRTSEHHWFDQRHLRRALQLPGMGALLLIFAMTTFAFAQFESTLPLLTLDAFGLDDQSNFYLFAYVGLILTICQGGIVRRMSKTMASQRIATTGASTLLAGMFGVVLAGATGSLWFFVVATLPIIAGFAMLTSSIPAMVSLRANSAEHGGILGVNQSGSAIARILGPFCGIILMDQSRSLPYWLAAGMMLLSIALLVRQPKDDASPE
ncbi:Tetracycline resistance protein, class C [Planctomycetes bacterium Pan216]|uniref:Tetracycline resistance protein, class C n=1 Tax=Kolteria novifilia TaxID=2527975 RepID=A0A518B7F2_9BACT|nr:Tetracycline resistance protein, class C [Planctomycetes bacterium Pan216]